MKKLSLQKDYTIKWFLGISVILALNAGTVFPQSSLKFTSQGESVVIDPAMAQRDVTLGELLQGRISNVKVTTADGAPGEAFDITVRGASSIRGDFQPLFILDGVMINSSQLDVENAWAQVDNVDYQAVQNMLWSINTEDVESIEVLKDASATAIYGSRGANGVIIIKTKSGSKNNRDITWTTNMGISTLARKQDLLSGNDYKNYYKELTGNNFVTSGQEKDWQKEVFRPAFSNNNNLSLAGTIRKTNYYVSLMSNLKNGLVPGTDELDLGLRTNLDQNISSMVNVGVRFLVSYNKTNMTQSTYLLGGSSLVADLGAVPFDENGENPVSWKDGYSDESNSWRVIPQAYFNFTFNPFLKANITGGVDYVDKTRYRWMGREIDRGRLENGRAGHAWLQTTLYNLSANVSYDRIFNVKHRVKAAVGGELFADEGIKLGNYLSDFSIQVLQAKAINFASYAANPIYTKNSSTTYAGYGRVNYNFDNLIEVALGSRADYLVDFDKSAQAYPFANIRWNVFEKKDAAINKLSIHGGWGVSGKNELVPYALMNNISLGDPSLFIPYENALSFTGRIEARLEQFNAGFDAQFLNKRIRFSGLFFTGNTNDRFDVYNFKDTDDDIYWRKTLEMDKWGLEASIFAIPIKNDNLTWTIDANIGMERSKVTNCGMQANASNLGWTGAKGFTGRSVDGLSDLGVTAYIEGHAPGVFYGYMTQGVITEEHVLLTPPFDGVHLRVGDPKYIDMNGDGSVDSNDKVIIGNPNPDFIFGINSNLKYKQWSFGIHIDGSVGNDVLNLNKVQLENVGKTYNVTNDAYKDAYRISASGNATGSLPMVGAQLLEQVSNRMVEDGSYVRLSNLSVGYDILLNEKMKTYFNGLTVNFMASNLLMLTKYNGFDPVVNSFAGDWSRQGIDLGAYPQTRTFSLGFVAKF